MDSYRDAMDIRYVVRVGLVGAALAGMAPALALGQPSLAEVARLETARRHAITQPAPVYTRATLPVIRPATIVASATAAAQATTPAPITKPAPPPAAAVAPKVASPRPWGRVAFFATAMQVSPDEGASQHAEEFTSTVAFHSPDGPATFLEYGLDARATKYTARGRARRLSLYEAWAGVRLLDDALRVRGGHLWVTEVGGLGSIAGGLVEYKHGIGAAKLRLAAFGGREPVAFDTGYVPDVTRVGGYVALDATGLRRHTMGYVLIRNQGLTERSVLTTTNYLPVTPKVFVYQSAEYDLQGPAGQGTGGLSYFFSNARVTATSRIDLLGSYHRGRSIDTRTLTLDQINGRPVPLKSLEGLFFESLSGRVTVEVVKGVRLYAGYGRDRNNRDSDPTGRLQVGGHSGNLAGTGFDVTASWNRIDRGAPGTYSAYYVSVGRSLTPQIYLSGDYSTSLSVLRFTRGDGVIVESHPETSRYGLSAMWHMGRLVSLIVNGDMTRDDMGHEFRVFSGLTYRLPQ